MYFVSLIALLILGAFFAVSEISLAAAKRTRLQTLVEEGNKKAQQVFGTPVDGIVSKQLSWIGKQNPGLLSSTFQWLNSMQGGSLLIASIQRKVGVNADGYIGSNTIRAMQRWLGTPVDGIASNPSVMVKAFQHWLNQQ